MSKKVTSVIVLVVMFLSIVTSVFATPMLRFAPAGSSFKASVSFSKGKVNAVGTVLKTAPDSTASFVVVLQKKNGQNWTDVTTNTGSAAEVCASANAVKGETYRAHVTCTFSGADPVIKTSGAKTY